MNTDTSNGELLNNFFIDKIKIMYRDNEELPISAYNNYEFYGLLVFFKKYTEFIQLIREVKVLNTRYVAGLIHQKYISSSGIFKEILKSFNPKKFGYTNEIILLCFYFLNFTKVKSLLLFNNVNSKEFSVLINSLTKPSDSTLLKFLKMQLTDGIVSKFRKLVYSYVLNLNKYVYLCLHVDENFIKYQGTKKLSKGKSGTGNNFAGGFYRYFLTSAYFKLPVFSVSKDGNTRIEPEFLPLIDEFVQTFSKVPSILIFDRGVKSLSTVKELVNRGIDFICWAVNYKTILNKLKNIHNMKYQSFYVGLKKLLKDRAKDIELSNLSEKEKEDKIFINKYINKEVIRELLKNLDRKRKYDKYKEGDYIYKIKGHNFYFGDYGDFRSIILKKRNNEKLMIFTSIKKDVASSVEIVLMLKKEKQIEDFFKRKKEINGNRIFCWRLNEKKVQKTKLGNIIKISLGSELENYNKKLKRAQNDLKRLKSMLEAQYNLTKNYKINKNNLKIVIKTLKLKVLKKEKEVIEYENFIKWGIKKRMPTYFKKIRKTMELKYTIENFISVMNDLYFIISRMIAMDWAYSLELYKNKGDIDINDRKINEIRYMMPEKLNFILLKGGGKIYLDHNNGNILKIIMNCEYKHKDEDLMKYYVMLLNKVLEENNRYMDTNYGVKFENFLELPPKLVKII